MTLVEIGNCRDPLVDGIIGGYEFEDILDILDFPMESIEETETGFGANWDPQFLGPIPSSVLTEPPKVKIDTGPPYMLSGPVTSVSFHVTLKSVICICLLLHIFIHCIYEYSKAVLKVAYRVDLSVNLMFIYSLITLFSC